VKRRHLGRMTVQVREANADADPAAWLAQLSERMRPNDRALLARALPLALERYGNRQCAHGEPLLGHCREVTGILAALRLDGETVVAGLLSGLPTLSQPWEETVRNALGANVAGLVEGLARMGQIQALREHTDESGKTADRAAQLEALRKMLLAMVQDARVVLLKLADQTQTLRYIAGRGDAPTREAAARDTFELFAPLANRLGVWQLKWELEDLAFRCRDPATYKRIARELDEKRLGREQFIAQVMDELRAELGKAQIKAEVSGRPKHIYSIYRKLARKDRSLNELFDIRGVRVLVEDVKDCYAVLGLVHYLWTPLPKEFDDYIAKPKPNNYRSLHTAVVGPDQKVLEVQIRTYEMHQHSEFGVAAHWRYKEGAVRAPDAVQYNEKIAWLRQILDWKEGLADVADLAEYFRAGMFEDSVYVLTPQGRVIDLPLGSTPVDFAYHVHSELGHRCRGARVDGEMVSLNYALKNGQTVEIVAAKTGGPSRDWLNPELGFIHSQRARAKVRQWFNSQNLDADIAQGRQVVEKILQRAGMTALGLDDLAGKMGHPKLDEFLALVGRGEIGPKQLQNAVRETPAAQEAASAATILMPSPQETPAQQGEILVVGVDKLLTVLARCCKPVPPDPIIGFVSRGRGVTVHRRSCRNVARLAGERLITADWGNDAGRGRFAVDIEVESASDPDPMHEILETFSREKVRVTRAASHVSDLHARIAFTLEVNGLDQLDRLLGLVTAMPGVFAARRC
jgi:GTP pyrophosphokinase